ncbi:hypothetical protein GCM10022252_72760 [Streptosporangium oxazolinicum]|uniref:PPE family protein n=1 Tax=Streptosporangium oxazolinicum TaxID=909287 RepID=A0ABP8BJ06_9ACTN
MNRTTIAAGLVALGAVLAAPALAAGPAHATASPSDPWDGIGLGLGNGTGSGINFGNGTGSGISFGDGTGNGIGLGNGMPLIGYGNIGLL